MISNIQIKARIIEAIRTGCISQRELADKLKISSATISDYIHKNKMPSLETFANLCKVLDLDANEVLCLRD